MTDNREQEILERRAADLARRDTQTERDRKERLALLEFTLMSRRYAVRLDQVDAVTRIGEIISIPMTPRHLVGVIRRRGESIALVSLRHFFNASAEGIADADFAMLVQVRGKRFALQVEEVRGVLQLARDLLTDPPSNFDPNQASFVAGVTTDGLTCIDLDKLVEASGFSTGEVERNLRAGGLG
jgi:chemotaxis signal transduction protein